MTNEARRKARLFPGVMQTMPLALSPGLSYCKVDGQLVFLDIQNDRYFRLTEHLESALTSYLGGKGVPDGSIRSLIEQKILVERAVDIDWMPLSPLEAPTRSALEDALPTRRSSLSERLGTFAAVFSVQRQLKTRSLKQTLQNLVSLRHKRTSRSSPSGHDDDLVLEAAAAFRNARIYVPIATCCLLDSIAMIKFLANRKFHADLVFGVAGDPFSAHCWAQHGGTVLNDALGHILAFTPIRII
jgi:hypothetical protein